MGAFLTGLAGGLSEGLNQASNRNEEREDELLESQAAPIVARLKEPGLEPEDANTLRGQLVKMYGPKNGHKAIAKLNEIYGVNPQAAPQSITTERPAVSVPGGPTLPAEAPLTVGHAPRTVSDILAMGNQMANPKQRPLEARVYELEHTGGLSHDEAVTRALHEEGTKIGIEPKAVTAKPLHEAQMEQNLDAFAAKTLGPGKTARDLSWDQRLEAMHDIVGNSKVPMPGTPGWFNTLDPHAQRQFLKNENALSIAKNPYGLMNAVSNRMRANVSEDMLDIARDRLLFGPEVGNISNLDKSASELQDDAKLSEEREAHPTDIGDTGLSISWVKSNIAHAGRISNTEIELMLKSGSLDTQIKNKLGRTFTGKWDDDFRHRVVGDIKSAADVAQNVADVATEQYQGELAPPGSAMGMKLKGAGKLPTAKKSTEKPKTTNDKDPLGIL